MMVDKLKKHRRLLLLCSVIFMFIASLIPSTTKEELHVIYPIVLEEDCVDPTPSNQIVWDNRLNIIFTDTIANIVFYGSQNYSFGDYAEFLHDIKHHIDSLYFRENPDKAQVIPVVKKTTKKKIEPKKKDKYTHKSEYARKYYKNAQYLQLFLEIPASITLAQGILESDHGRSILATEANNHFGVKCRIHSCHHKKDKKGKITPVHHPSCKKGVWKGEDISSCCMQRKDEIACNRFKKHSSVEESFLHREVVFSLDRYQVCFKKTTTKDWAKCLKSQGYATSPTYDKKLIDIIQRYNLEQYDL